MSKEEQQRYDKLNKEREDSRIFQKSYESVRRVAKGSKVRAPLEAIRLGIYLRSQIDQHKEGVITLALIFALSIDFADMVPIAGWVITFFMRPLLFVLLWGKGAFKVKIVKIILILIDFIPGVGFLPWSTISVLYVYMKLKQKSNESEEKLKELKLAYGEEV